MLHDADLIATGGVGAFVGSLVLSLLAFLQVGAMRDQVGGEKGAADQQVRAITETTEKSLS
jgi:hypothetical protein